MPSVALSPRDRSDLRLLTWDAYAPLDAFTDEADHRSIVEDMRLSGGALWPFPIAPALDDEGASAVRGASSVDLIGPQGELLGAVSDPEVYRTDPATDVKFLFGTDDPAHPGVAAVLDSGPWRLGGKVEVTADLSLSAPFDRHPATPALVRAAIAERGWRTVVFFQTRNPIHRAHEYLTKCALETVDGLVVHPLVGETKGDDIPAEVRLRCYEVLLENYYPPDRALLALFAAPMRYAGPREAVLHALVRANFGATHFIVGRDHAGVGSYYGTYEAQNLLLSLGQEALGVVPVPFEHSFYCGACAAVASAKTCPHDKSAHLHLSGTRQRELLSAGELPPPELTRPEVAVILKEAYAS
ncbi:MAG: sulfate adenylyltransferase [Actinomycetota bacterium]|nr:sulfate adenylyltransferase [Actinomycetota bacterium]MDQ3575660.1 sulfate adenylyltransferase [Actinomycetota bacterium]